MIPILALAEVLVEGLVYFRRATTVYRVSRGVNTIASMIDDLTSDNLRKHKTVKGDDAYMWLLGRGMMSNVYKNSMRNPPTENVLTVIPLQALINNNFISTSPDAKSMINSYLYALGAEWQKFDDDAFTLMKDVIDSIDDSFQVEDPVYSLFKDIDILPNDYAEPIYQLGISAEEMNVVIKGFKDPNSTMALAWTTALERAGDGKPSYKVESALGIMIQGAKSVMPLTQTAIPFAAELPDLGFSLNSGYMYKQVPEVVHHEPIKSGLSITKEQTEAMSRTTMESRGFIYDKGKWIKIENTQHQKETDEGPEGLVASGGVAIMDQLSGRLETKLNAMARLNRIKKLIKP